jgi:hypothetical protein
LILLLWIVLAILLFLRGGNSQKSHRRRWRPLKSCFRSPASRRSMPPTSTRATPAGRSWCRRCCRR